MNNDLGNGMDPLFSHAATLDQTGAGVKPHTHLYASEWKEMFFE